MVRRAVLSLALAFTGAVSGCRATRMLPEPAPEVAPPSAPVVADRDTARRADSVRQTPPPVEVVPPVAPPPPPQPATPEPPPLGLPGMPTIVGAPLVVTVVYPPSGQLIAARDSNFILGSVGTGDATLEINGTPVEVKSNGAYLAWLPIPPGTNPSYRLVARRASDSIVLEHAVRTWRTPTPPPRPPAPPRTIVPGPVALGRMGTAPADTDRVINVRPVPGGTYKWFAIPGTIVQRTGIENGFTRIRLDSTLEAYVANADVVEPADTATLRLPTRTVGNLVVAPDSTWTDVVFPLSSPPMFLVDQERDQVVVTLYGARATTDLISFRPGSSIVRAVTWEPLTNDRVRYVIQLRGAPFGYLAFHDGRAFRVRVRHAPRIRRDRPLVGITIAVDAGHPPIGSTGPTGLYEGDATLGIGIALKAELERRGASVVMTRTTRDPVDLMLRPVLARRAGAHAFVSIHLNAVPDGVNPLLTHGTGTYYFHAQSEPLARAVQDGMVRSMELRDLGVYFNNLAVVRTTWMPAVLCEGAFAIIPEQEAAMRDPQGQRAYARGVADGIETYFLGLAAAQ